MSYKLSGVSALVRSTTFGDGKSFSLIESQNQLVVDHSTYELSSARLTTSDAAVCESIVAQVRRVPAGQLGVFVLLGADVSDTLSLELLRFLISSSRAASSSPIVEAEVYAKEEHDVLIESFGEEDFISDQTEGMKILNALQGVSYAILKTANGSVWQLLFAHGLQVGTSIIAAVHAGQAVCNVSRVFVTMGSPSDSEGQVVAFLQEMKLALDRQPAVMMIRQTASATVPSRQGGAEGLRALIKSNLSLAPEHRDFYLRELEELCQSQPQPPPPALAATLSPRAESLVVPLPSEERRLLDDQIATLETAVEQLRGQLAETHVQCAQLATSLEDERAKRRSEVQSGRREIEQVKAEAQRQQSLVSDQLFRLQDRVAELESELAAVEAARQQELEERSETERQSDELQQQLRRITDMVAEQKQAQQGARQELLETVAEFQAKEKRWQAELMNLFEHAQGADIDRRALEAVVDRQTRTIDVASSSVEHQRVQRVQELDSLLWQVRALSPPSRMLKSKRQDHTHSSTPALQQGGPYEPYYQNSSGHEQWETASQAAPPSLFGVDRSVSNQSRQSGNQYPHLMLSPDPANF